MSESAAATMKSPNTIFDPATPDLRAESITIRIRWFGLAVGYLLVNIRHLLQLDGPNSSLWQLNAILTLGLSYAVIDTLRSKRGKVLLAEFRIMISFMEALFVGLLCYFDGGVDSPFRFYYFLSLMVCAIRHSPAMTFATFGVHAASYSLLALFGPSTGSDDSVQLVLTLVFLGWVSWAIIALTGLLKSAGFQLIKLNNELKSNQEMLEDRIMARTKELQESQALLVQQEKQAAFGLLAAGIAHEVGNPLASISSIVQMLGRRVEDEHTRERLGMVEGQLSRIHRTLQELVGFSRPANQTATRIDVHSAINDSLNIAKYYKRWKGKTVNTDFAGGIKPIRTIYDQLVQVVLNLVLNALDATEEGASISVTTLPFDASEEAPGSFQGQPVVAIHIEDEGHGIPQDAQAKIFEPYFTTKPTGTGLGLFVCRQLTRQELNGDIQLMRSDVSGTEFRILVGAIEPQLNPKD